jgi:hypothetical protein
MMILPGLTSDEAKNLILSVGTHHGRRPLSPMEVATLFQKAIKKGASKKLCAQFVHLNGPSMVSRFLKLLELSSLVQLSTDWGQKGSTISFSSAQQLSNLSKDEQEMACREIMTNQLTRVEVEQIVQLKQRSGRTIAECLNDIIRMRPTITKVHVILGAITNTDVQERLSKYRQIERDNLFQGVISEMYPSGRTLSGRLGISQFSIVTDEQGFNIISPKQGPSFEHVITQVLANKLIVDHD